MELKQRKLRINICLWILAGLMFVSLIIIPFVTDSILYYTMKIGMLFPIMFITLFYQCVMYFFERNKFHNRIFHTEQ